MPNPDLLTLDMVEKAREALFAYPSTRIIEKVLIYVTADQLDELRKADSPVLKNKNYQVLVYKQPQSQPRRPLFGKGN